VGVYPGGGGGRRRRDHMAVLRAGPPPPVCRWGRRFHTLSPLLTFSSDQRQHRLRLRGGHTLRERTELPPAWFESQPRDVKRSTLTQQPTIPWSSLLRQRPRQRSTLQLTQQGRCVRVLLFTSLVVPPTCNSDSLCSNHFQSASLYSRIHPFLTFDREYASSMVTAGATANTTEGKQSRI